MSTQKYGTKYVSCYFEFINKINALLKIRILIYLGKGISAAYSAAFRGVPTKEGELQLTVRNPLPTKVTLWGIGLDALVQG